MPDQETVIRTWIKCRRDVAAVTAYSTEQEHAVLNWLGDHDGAISRPPGIDADLVSAITVSLIAAGAINLQTLRLAGKEWVLDA